MNAHSMRRAFTQGTKTVPVEHRKAKYIRGDIKLSAEELAIALDMARGDRTERQIAAYAIRKRES